MRRTAVSNYQGAYNVWKKANIENMNDLKEFESTCIFSLEKKDPVAIEEIIRFLKDRFNEK